MQLAGDNFLNIDKVTKEPLNKCLLFLAYQSDRVETEKLVSKEMMKKMKV